MKAESREIAQRIGFIQMITKATVASLKINALDRLQSADILEKNNHVLTGMECAFLGVELAFKAVLESHSITDYKKNHNFSGLFSLFSAKLKADKIYAPIWDTFYRLIEDPESDAQFWKADYRYSKTTYSESELKVAKKMMAASKLLLETLPDD